MSSALARSYSSCLVGPSSASGSVRAFRRRRASETGSCEDMPSAFPALGRLTRRDSPAEASGTVEPTMARSTHEMRDGDVGSVVVVENGNVAGSSAGSALADIASEPASA